MNERVTPLRKYDGISTVFWFLIGLYTVREGYTVHLGTLKEPGPGFILFWAGVILCGLSVFTFLQSQFSRNNESQDMWADVRWQKPLLILLITVTYSILFERIGFLITTFILMVMLFKFSGIQKWTKVVGGSIVSVIFCWFLFDYWLKCQFPKGQLENLIINALKLQY